MEYTEELLNEFFNPVNVGVIKGASGVGKVVDNQNGEIMKIYIMVQKDKVVDAKFQTYGCVPSIACSSMATKMIIGLTLAEIENNITSKAIIKELGGKLAESKVRCAEMAVKTVRNAIKNFEKKASGEKVDNDEE